MRFRRIRARSSGAPTEKPAAKSWEGRSRIRVTAKGWGGCITLVKNSYKLIPKGQI